MSDTPLAKTAACLFAHTRADHVPIDERAAVAAIELAIVRRARAARRRAVSAGVMVSVACAVALLIVFRHLSPPVVTASAGDTSDAFWGGASDPAHLHPLTTGARITVGEQLVTGEQGRAVVRLSTDTVLGIGPRSDLSILELGQAARFVLKRGVVRADVRPLVSGQRFVIETEDATIEVKGTSFEVSRADTEVCEIRTRSRVKVFEGTVSVRHGDRMWRVARGTSWPAGCDESQAEPAQGSSLPSLGVADSAAHVQPPNPKRAGEGTTPEKAKTPSTNTAPGTVGELYAPLQARSRHVALTARPISDLELQNELFSSALAAKRNGNVERAEALFHDFPIRYPHSELVESAMVERVRLLRTHDLELAKSEARAYLAKFPLGFAHVEAAAIVSQGR